MLVEASAGLQRKEGEETMLRRMILMLTLAAIAAVVLTAWAGGAPAAESPNVKTCKSGQVCKGTEGPDWIFGTERNDNIRPMGGGDYVFANRGDDQVAHSYGDDRIFGGCGSDTVRGGFGLDRIFANTPDSWPPPPDNSECVYISPNLSPDQIEALAQAVGNDVPDKAHDLVDCAWLASRGSPAPDEGFGSAEEDPVLDDTVVDCSNRDDQ